MLLDATLTFDPAGTALPVATGTQVSTNVIDLGGPAIGGANGRDVGIGGGGIVPQLVVAINGVTGNTGATLQIKLQGAPDNGSGAPGTYIDFVDSPVYTLAQLQATTGEQFFFPVDLPPRPPGSAPPRFLQLSYVSATAALTAGTVQSYIAIGRDDFIAGNSNFTPPPTSGAGS